jgi:hypothetical protein
MSRSSAASSALLALLCWHPSSARAEDQPVLFGVTGGFETRTIGWERAGTDGSADIRTLGGGIGLDSVSRFGRIEVGVLFSRVELEIIERNFRNSQSGADIPIGEDRSAPFGLRHALALSLEYGFPITLYGPLAIEPFVQVGGGLPVEPGADQPSETWLDVGGGAAFVLGLFDYVRLSVGARGGYRWAWFDPGESDTILLRPDQIPVGMVAAIDVSPPDGGFLFKASARLIDQTWLDLHVGWRF